MMICRHSRREALNIGKPLDIALHCVYVSIQGKQLKEPQEVDV